MIIKKLSFLSQGILSFGFTVVLLATSASGQAFLATNDFAAVTTTSGVVDPTTPPSVSGVAFAPFAAVGYAGNTSGAGRFSFATNSLGGINGINDFAQFTGSLDPAKYYEVTLTPQAGYTLDLDTISFTVQRSSTGIRSYSVRSSLDGYAANLSASISPANGNLGVGANNDFQYLLDSLSNAQGGSLVTLGAPFDVLSAPVTFRFYGWNAEGTGGTFSIDTVIYSGTTTAVPEPGAIAFLAGFGILGLMMSARNRK